MGFRDLISILRRLSRDLPDVDRPIRPASYRSMAGLRLCIDTNLYLHLCRGHRSPPEIAALFAAWARRMVSSDVEPIFVFDGARRPAPGCVTTRSPPMTCTGMPSSSAGPVRPPVRRCDQWKASGIELSRPASAPNSGTWSLVKRILDREGVAWIAATNDTDSFCALLAHDSLQLVDAVASEDSVSGIGRESVVVSADRRGRT